MAIFDNHFHLRPSGLGVEAAKTFEKAGGTALMLTHSPYDDIPIRRAGDYDLAYDRTLSMARAVRDATHLKVFVALGPYPVDLLPLQESIGLAGGVSWNVAPSIRRIEPWLRSIAYAVEPSCTTSSPWPGGATGTCAATSADEPSSSVTWPTPADDSQAVPGRRRARAAGERRRARYGGDHGWRSCG